jgi:hypothetical protein
MTKVFTLILAIAFAFSALPNASADIWDGPSIEFTKDPFADWTLPENQDFITPNVIITRADVFGIFNIAQEASYTSFSSPVDTEWATGTTADIGSLMFSDWQTWTGSNPPNMVGVDAVLHLITDDIYIDIRFTSWGIGGASGGGFSYIRSTQGIPEPASGLVILAVGGLVVSRRRR